MSLQGFPLPHFGGKLCSGPAWDYDWGTFIPMENIGTGSSSAGSIKNYYTARYTMWYTYLFNHKMWPCTGFNHEYPNFDESLTWDEATAQMRYALEARIEWLDGEIAGM